MLNKNLLRILSLILACIFLFYAIVIIFSALTDSHCLLYDSIFNSAIAALIFGIALFINFFKTFK